MRLAEPPKAHDVDLIMQIAAFRIGFRLVSWLHAYSQPSCQE